MNSTELKNNLEEEHKNLQQVDKTDRFGNCLIDTVGFYFLLFVQLIIFKDVLDIIPEDSSNWGVVYMILFYVLYYTLFEHFLGKTPGKFLTKTKVVDKDGHHPSFMKILGRSAARLIPLDTLSFLFLKSGWHDALSGTYVVHDLKKKQTK